MSLADIRLLARWCPAYRWREPGLRRPSGTGEGVSGYCPPLAGDRGELSAVQEVPVGGGVRVPVAGGAGGPARSSGEGPVMGLERRGRVVRDCVRSINRDAAASSGGVVWTS